MIDTESQREIDFGVNKACLKPNNRKAEINYKLSEDHKICLLTQFTKVIHKIHAVLQQETQCDLFYARMNGLNYALLR